MGCDIHFFAEKRAKESRRNKTGRRGWRKIGARFNDRYYQGLVDRLSKEGKPIPSWAKPKTDEAYQSRNYYLFGILAEVRNLTFRPIDSPRGLPDDVSNVIRKLSDNYGSDGHSHSYFTVQELLDYDWHGQKAVLHGTVDPVAYASYLVNGKPSEYSGGVWGSKVEKITNSQMDNVVVAAGYMKRYKENKLLKSDPHFYTEVTWEQTAYEVVKEFVDETIPALKAMGDPNDVRVVFWFDN